MKTNFFSFFIFFILNIFSISVYAENVCIKNIDQHRRGYILDLSKCHLQDQDMSAVASFIKKNPYDPIDSLLLSDNNIGPNGIADLKLNEIDTLILDNNNLGDDGVDKLFKAIPHINILSLKNNHLTDKTASTLEKISLPRDNLDLSDNHITVVGIRYLVKNPSLKTLRINNNFIGDDGAIALANKASLDMIMASNNQLTDTAAIEISKHINLKEVILSNNKITAKGAHALASNPDLRYLDLSHNRIGDDGIKAFIHNYYLEWLFVSDNQIGPEGAIAIANFVSNKGGFHTLDISQNPIGLTGVAALGKIPTLKLLELDISDTNLGDSGVKVFAENHPPMGIIKLAKNHITKKGLDDLLKGLPRPTWVNLDLSSNDLGDDGAALFAREFNEELNLSNNHITVNGIKSLLNFHGGSLNLSNNDIGDEGAANISKIKWISHVNLEHCGITDKGAILLTKNERKINFMNIRNNPIGKSGIAALKEWFSGEERDLEIDE